MVRLCSTLEYRKNPPRPFEIDPYDLILTILNRNGPRETHQLPVDGDGRGSEELKLWNRFVAPHFYDKRGGLLLDVDVRPCPRNYKREDIL